MSQSDEFRYTHEHPQLGVEPLDTKRYYSETFFEQEREKIFKHCWLNIGREEEIPEPGDYIVRELEICKTSVLVVRGKDGQIRAFHNMCSHRANPVAWDERGHCPGVFVCRFHAWSYDTEGKLVSITDKDRFFDVKKEENGLTPISLDSWSGFIFINLQAEPEQSLAEFLSPADEAMKGYPFDKLSYTYFYKIKEKVNWKLLQEAQQEGWHLPYLHKNTLAKSATNSGELFRHAAVKCYGKHGLVSSHAPRDYKPSPSAAVSMKFGTGTFDAFAIEDEKDESANDFVWHGAFDLYHVFPNMFIGLLRGSFFTYHIWPLSVDESIWEVRFYYPKAKNAGELFALEYGKAGLRDALREDSFTHEKVQSVIASGAKEVLHFQDEELVLRNFNHFVDEYVNKV
ncbi:MAG: Rieske 2Fe-2S domain-containing protein [Gammaproteobacteria bacterium]|nr:Rieske 2Fe-2S domain-containing protein [Gammaproteobacteria bacterium]